MRYTLEDTTKLLHLLAARFTQNAQRHPGIAWPSVQDRLAGRPDALQALASMEASGGEPDVIGAAGPSGSLLFIDCAPESPAGRRSTCYDGAARTARKEAQPGNSAAEMAAAMGIALLTEEQYRQLQAVGEFDRKTSSWISTPERIRSLGGALFCDRRYGQVFTYHNGAQSYYAARGFRGVLEA